MIGKAVSNIPYRFAYRNDFKGRSLVHEREDRGSSAFWSAAIHRRFP
jgi:hypothetical protein